MGLFICFVLSGGVHKKLFKYINKSHFIYIATEFMPDNLRALLLSRHLLFRHLFEALTGSNLRGVPQGDSGATVINFISDTLGTDY